MELTLKTYKNKGLAFFFLLAGLLLWPLVGTTTGGAETWPGATAATAASLANSSPAGQERFAAAVEPIRPLPRQLDHDPKRARLGQRLFGDPLLSLDRSVSCASCHDLDGGGHDPRGFSTGIKGRQGTMTSPTVFNAVFNFRQFWNGRAADLREQAEGPLKDPVEMGMSEAELERRLRESDYYRQAFGKIYGRPPAFTDLLDALAQFQRTLITPDSPFDLYLRGEAALGPHERQGYLAFKELGCVTCHNGVNIGGNSFQQIGVINPLPPGPAEGTRDRRELTGHEQDRHVFKVPTLRNIALTSPYFHDGSAATLAEALRYMAYHNLGVPLGPEQAAALTAFLHTLTGPRPEILTEP